MNSSETYQRLMEGYSIENLNKISSALIRAYREKDDDFICDLSRRLNEQIGTQKINQLFFRLIMRYHPDRHRVYLDQMQKYYLAGETNKLQRFASIFQTLKWINDREKRAGTATAFSSNFSRQARRSEADPEDAEIASLFWEESGPAVRDFISALRHKEYGNLDVVYTPNDLANSEGDLELSGYGISNLSGLECCQNLTGLDLSDNNIDDISALSSLILLQEINLSKNRITRLDALSDMNDLIILDVSFNQIEDLSPLINLNHLEFVNAIGDPVSQKQIDLFRKKGVIVVFS
ncbi:leucine-rich repeat protein [bacterium]|nr:leucine-rich repeat protein [bacterium]